MTEHARAILARAIVALAEVDYELRVWREALDEQARP